MVVKYAQYDVGFIILNVGMGLMHRMSSFHRLIAVCTLSGTGMLAYLVPVCITLAGHDGITTYLLP